jgi:hypothetical protein
LLVVSFGLKLEGKKGGLPTVAVFPFIFVPHFFYLYPFAFTLFFNHMGSGLQSFEDPEECRDGDRTPYDACGISRTAPKRLSRRE